MPHTHEEDAPTTVRDRTVAHDRPGYVEREYSYSVRGGFSFGAILTGVVVALGAFLLLASLIGGVVAATGVDIGTPGDEVVQLGWGAAIGLIVAQLLAYLWGGYTSGRMARGVGWLNGLMVPIVAIILGVLIGLIVRAMGADMGVAVQYGATRVPVGIEAEQLRNIGLVAGIGSLVAMFVGAILGGMLGARWHDKLEARSEMPEAHLRAA